MGFFSKLLGSKKADRSDDKPPIYGGDGMSAHSPAIINCASIGMAQRLMDKFITEKFGDGWSRGVEFTLESPTDSEKRLKAICVSKPDGSEGKFYFDLSRPLGNAMKMMGIQ